MITVRPAEGLYQAKVPVQNGMMHGQWHSSFDTYRDPDWVRFGSLRALNDDTLSPGAVWPLHPHREIEVVTYCADGEFRHADESGQGGVLTKGGVQHTTVGRGTWHSEINNRQDAPMRFIQMWFLPSAPGLAPSVEPRVFEPSERRNRLLPLVTDDGEGALLIFADARVYASAPEAGRSVVHDPEPGHGAYLLVLEGGPLEVNGAPVAAFGAARAVQEDRVEVLARGDGEFLLVDVGMA